MCWQSPPRVAQLGSAVKPIKLLTPLQPLGLLLAALTTGWPLLAGLAIALGASYGQVVLNDAMIARYVPGPLRVKAVSIRYFIGFGACGFAVPLIALMA
jgi:hypothetical protein